MSHKFRDLEFSKFSHLCKIKPEISAFLCVQFLRLNRNTSRFPKSANVTSREPQMQKQFRLSQRESSSVRKDTLYQIQSSGS